MHDVSVWDEIPWYSSVTHGLQTRAARFAVGVLKPPCFALWLGGAYVCSGGGAGLVRFDGALPTLQPSNLVERQGALANPTGRLFCAAQLVMLDQVLVRV